MGFKGVFVSMLAVVTGGQIGNVDAPSSLVELLRSPSERDAAFCRLVELGLYRDGNPRYKEPPCTDDTTLNHVILAPQESDAPITMVFVQPSYEVGGVGPGKPRLLLVFRAHGLVRDGTAGARRSGRSGSRANQWL